MTSNPPSNAINPVPPENDRANDPTANNTDELIHSLKRLEEENLELKSTVDTKQATIDELVAELDSAKAKEHDLQLAYDYLSREHRARGEGSSSTISSEEFGESSDIISSGEVEQWFKTLIAQILTISGTCSDILAIKAWFKEPNEPRKPLKESDVEMVNNLRQIIGQKLLDALTELDYSENQLAIVLSMQAIMGFFVSKVCEAYPFSPTRKANLGNGIWSIYKDVHENELQAVSSRWRSIGSSYSRSKSSTNDLQLEMRTCTLQYLARVLYVAGVSKDIIKLQQYCWSCVATGVKELWPAAIQFAEYLKEHVFSTDYAVIYVTPSSVDRKVRDTPQEIKTEQPPVLCTAQLGLSRTTNMAKLGETKNMKSEVILRAVVIYEHEFERMMRV